MTPDLERLELAAQVLGLLCDECVFTGGTITSLLITDPAAPPTRPTEDVDAVVEVVSRVEYYALEARLREAGLEQRHDAPVACRWFLGKLVLDVMPTNEQILGFSNRWYADAYRHPMDFRLPSGTNIKIVSPIHFLATKLEAFDGRGNGDYQASHDIEDIIAVIDGRREILVEIIDTESEVGTYLRRRFNDLLDDQPFVDALNGHLAGEQQRLPIVLARLYALAGKHR